MVGARAHLRRACVRCLASRGEEQQAAWRAARAAFDWPGSCNSCSMNRCSTMRFASIFALFMSSLSLSSIAAAAPRHRYYYRDRGYYPDHQGLLLRVSGGLGGVVADDNL